MPWRGALLLKASLARHPLLWTIGILAMGAGMGVLLVYHTGFKEGVREATPKRIVTEDGREYDLDIPPRVGLTGRPVLGMALKPSPYEIRPAIGIETGRIHPINFDLTATLSVQDGDLKWKRTGIGPAVTAEITLNTSAGGTFQWEPGTGDTWVGLYIRWRF